VVRIQQVYRLDDRDAKPPQLVVHYIFAMDVTDSEYECDGIRHIFRSPKYDGHLKSDSVGFEIFVLFRSNSKIIFVNNHCRCYITACNVTSTMVIYENDFRVGPKQNKNFTAEVSKVE